MFHVSLSVLVFLMFVWLKHCLSLRRWPEVCDRRRVGNYPSSSWTFRPALGFCRVNLQVEVLVLVDLGHNMELGEESIQVTGPHPEGCQELLMADNSLIKD